MVLKKHSVTVALYSLVSVFVLHGSFIYFGIKALSGSIYVQSDDDSSFILYSVFLVLIAIWFFYKDVLLSFSRKSALIIVQITPILLALNYIFFPPLTELGQRQLIMHIIFALPAILAGVHVARMNEFSNFVKALDLVWIFLTISFISVIAYMLKYGVVTFGGASYQTLAYASAYAFSLNFVLLSSDVEFNRFRFTRTRLFELFSVLSLLLQISIVVISGGRGGMVFTIVISLLYVGRFIRKLLRKGLLKFSLIVFALLFLSRLVNEELVSRLILGFSRSFNYLNSESGFELKQTGRSEIYSEVIASILSNPLLGNGFYRYMDKMPSPHNIFIEMCVQGGIFYLFFWLIIMVIALRRLMKAIVQNEKVGFIVPMTLYPICLLMFSGSYLWNGHFWFALSFIFAFNLKKRKIIQ